MNIYEDYKAILAYFCINYLGPFNDTTSIAETDIRLLV